MFFLPKPGFQEALPVPLPTRVCRLIHAIITIPCISPGFKIIKLKEVGWRPHRHPYILAVSPTVAYVPLQLNVALWPVHIFKNHFTRVNEEFY